MSVSLLTASVFCVCVKNQFMYVCMYIKLMSDVVVHPC